jgi:hypothetical protein
LIISRGAPGPAETVFQPLPLQSGQTWGADLIEETFAETLFTETLFTET